MVPHHPLRSVCLTLLALLFCTAPLTLPALPVGATGSTWTVNDLGDSGTTTCAANAGAGGVTCQLRDALSKAQDGDTVTFASGLTGTIALNTPLAIGSSITLSGPTSGAGVTIDGGGVIQVLTVATGKTVSISNLTIANGFTSGNGGGINNHGTATVTNAGGAPVTITGAGFAPVSAVSFGGVAATNVIVVNSTTITATTPAHAAGAVDVAVTTSGVTGTLTNGYTYGTITALPSSQPGNGAGSPAPNGLPVTRPTGSTSGSPPNSLPAPRP